MWRRRRRRRGRRHHGGRRLDPAVATTTADTAASGSTEAPASSAPATTAGATTAPASDTSATAECPDGDSVPIAVPYEGNQPAGENWRLGIEMAVAEINEAGGILGCQIAIEFQDTQADPDVSKQVVADMAEDDPYVFLGTVFSARTRSSTWSRPSGPRSRCSSAPRRRPITNREENGDNDFIYRTSFGVDTAAEQVRQLHRRPGRRVGRRDLQERRVRRRWPRGLRGGVRGGRHRRSASTSSSSPTRPTCRPR